MMRIRHCLLAGLVVVAAAGCKRGNDQSASGAGTSAFLDDASPEAREALAIQVDYRLTDENFARWEVAQRNLDRLPRSAFPALSGGGAGNVIDRAVARLESSPKARTAIEAAGLSVRDFVLQTIALAQATEAAQSGRSAGAALVPPENFRFVDRHRERILRAQAAARVARRNAESAEMQLDAAEEVGAEMGLESSSSAADSAASAQSDQLQRAKRDTVESDDDRAREEPRRDSTRDSLSAEQRGR